MKDMYQVTRPSWAELGKSETIIILIASLLVGIYGGFGEVVGDAILTRIGVHDVRSWWRLLDVVITTLACLAVIRGYQLLKVRSYPSTFLYCFNLPAEFNSSDRSQVIGYCHIVPNRETGEILVEGASFDWDDGDLNIQSCVSYKSTQVRAIEDDGDTVCQIRLDIEKKDYGKRRYRGGLLEFRLANTVRDPGRKRIDVYAGYFKSVRGASDSQELEVRSKGIAEWYCRGKSNDIDMAIVLRKRGDAMFDRLDSMLSTRPLPPLWQTDEDDEVYANRWNYPIPMPQEAILNRRLRPHIDRFLEKVLDLSGASEREIEDFKQFARMKARLAGDSRAFERRLKAGLYGKTRELDKFDAMADRAALVAREIDPYLAGNSLLDIGCGNGLIADKIKERFTGPMRLLDVVDHVPRSLKSAFTKYADGDDLPVSAAFDTVLLLNVLHHSRDPLRLLKAAWVATEKRLIIIESVIGVHKRQDDAKYDLLDATDEDQIAYAAFVDWFYNRVLDDEVPVPYNFTKPEHWMSIFSENGMRVAKVIHLGQDIEIGPEYHVLFVLEKEAQQQTGPRLVLQRAPDVA